jgi:hypothetical protein
MKLDLLAVSSPAVARSPKGESYNRQEFWLCQTTEKTGKITLQNVLIIS